MGGRGRDEKKRGREREMVSGMKEGSPPYLLCRGKIFIQCAVRIWKQGLLRAGGGLPSLPPSLARSMLMREMDDRYFAEHARLSVLMEQEGSSISFVVPEPEHLRQSAFLPRYTLTLTAPFNFNLSRYGGAYLIRSSHFLRRF